MVDGHLHALLSGVETYDFNWKRRREKTWNYPWEKEKGEDADDADDANEDDDD